jgi:hypothetical protein
MSINNNVTANELSQQAKTSGTTEPQKTTPNHEDINENIQRHHRKKMGINKARAQHLSRDQEDATKKE